MTTGTLPQKSSWVPLIAVAVTMMVIGILYWLIQTGATEVPERTPTRFILPQDFAGPVKVYYGIQDAEALPMEEGFRVIEVPPSGIVQTSSEPLYGRALDEFVRQTGAEEADETLGYHFVRDRKNGLTGDGQEYFLRPEELELRDAELVRHGIVDPEDGTPRYGVPYEMFSIRDDF